MDQDSGPQREVSDTRSHTHTPYTHLLGTGWRGLAVGVQDKMQGHTRVTLQDACSSAGCICVTHTLRLSAAGADAAAHAAACRPVGELGESYWLYNVPWSIGRMLRYMKQRYDNPYIWVLENGISEKGESKRSGTSALQDDLRTDYFKGYITESCK